MEAHIKGGELMDAEILNGNVFVLWWLLWPLRVVKSFSVAKVYSSFSYLTPLILI